MVRGRGEIASFVGEQVWIRMPQWSWKSGDLVVEWTCTLWTLKQQGCLAILNIWNWKTGLTRRSRRLQFSLQPYITLYGRSCESEATIIWVGPPQAHFSFIICTFLVYVQLWLLYQMMTIFFPQLSNFYIRKLDSIASVAFKNLRSLETISIYRCPKLWSKGLTEKLSRHDLNTTWLSAFFKTILSKHDKLVLHFFF